MLILLSPAKKQDFDTTPHISECTQIHFAPQTATLLAQLRQYNAKALAKLMHISDALALLNVQRYQNFDCQRYDNNNSKPAIFAFQGDVYQALKAKEFSKDDLAFAQDHLLILSGLYGLLRPLDLIQPYRLEMKTPLKTENAKDLYAFWGNALTEYINQQLEQSKHPLVINLASNEYFKAIQPKSLKGKLIDIDFKEYKDGSYKTIGIHAKRARGLMARHIITHRLETAGALKNFGEGGYAFNENLSDEHRFVFARG